MFYSYFFKNKSIRLVENQVKIFDNSNKDNQKYVFWHFNNEILNNEVDKISHF